MLKDNGYMEERSFIRIQLRALRKGDGHLNVRCRIQ
jgi:hypothetical protein